LPMLDRMPSARIFLLDGSERMISSASNKVAQSNPGAILGCRVVDLA
jgi:hypothetical protein